MTAFSLAIRSSRLQLSWQLTNSSRPFTRRTSLKHSIFCDGGQHCLLEPPGSVFCLLSPAPSSWTVETPPPSRPTARHRTYASCPDTLPNSDSSRPVGLGNNPRTLPGCVRLPFTPAYILSPQVNHITRQYLTASTSVETVYIYDPSPRTNLSRFFLTSLCHMAWITGSTVLDQGDTWLSGHGQRNLSLHFLEPAGGPLSSLMFSGTVSLVLHCLGLTRITPLSFSLVFWPLGWELKKKLSCLPHVMFPLGACSLIVL